MRMQHLKRRHKKMHRSPILKNKEARRNQRRNPRQGLSASAWWRTGHWCPVCTGLSAQRGHRQALSGCSTGLSGVHRTVRCANGQKATVESNGRLLQAPTVGWRGVHRTSTVQCPVVHRTVRCTRRQKAAAFCPTASWGVEAINTTPTGHSLVWEPKQHSNTHSAYFQVLKHPSA
jgi:hypothetical protein